MRDRGLTSRRVLIGIGYEGGTGRLRDIFQGKQLPTPETLRAICDLTGAPYLEAVAQYGYYREFIAILDRLVRLGEQWLEEDDARAGTLGPSHKPAPRLESLRDTGVRYWKGQPITRDTLEDATFLNRYFVGSSDEGEHEVLRVEYEPIEYNPGATATLALNPTTAVKQEVIVAPASHVSTALPKPIALAIMLAILTFPRRGDVYKDEALDYRQELYAPADVIVTLAEQHSTSRTVGRPKLPHPLLRRSQEALGDRVLPFEVRRMVAAEPAVAWAHELCRPFTDYAQSATFDEFGEAGSSSSTRTRYVDMPQRFKAELPSIETLTTYT